MSLWTVQGALQGCTQCPHAPQVPQHQAVLLRGSLSPSDLRHLISGSQQDPLHGAVSITREVQD